jgi:hypothetical protein
LWIVNITALITQINGATIRRAASKSTNASVATTTTTTIDYQKHLFEIQQLKPTTRKTEATCSQAPPNANGLTSDCSNYFLTKNIIPADGKMTKEEAANYYEFLCGQYRSTSAKCTQEIELFKSRSISGHIIWLEGPIHWTSKRQTITARSSAEAEIYATDECTKNLIQLSHILTHLPLNTPVMTLPSIIYNDNMACVCLSKATTTKGLRHVQIRENAVRESVQSNFITVQHIERKINLSDHFTKEDKDADHFITLRDLLLHDSVDTNL